VNGWVVVFWNKWKRVIYRYICERRLGHVGITPIYGGDTIQIVILKRLFFER
jgi:hypothetical protein